VTDRAALLNAVLENPDDDLPRLIFADWCDEHGEAMRAMFIRLPTEKRYKGLGTAEELGDISASRHRLLRRRMEWGGRMNARVELPNGRLGGWLNDRTEPLEPDGQFIAEYRRGFAESVSCTAATAVAHLDAVLAAHPVTSVTLTTWPTSDEFGVNGWVRRVAASDALEFDPLATCKARWPTVRAWHLPPEPTNREFDRVQITRTRDGDLCLWQDGRRLDVISFDPLTNTVTAGDPQVAAPPDGPR
jgi:uncharacterized protein (TIGR02996 family)